MRREQHYDNCLRELGKGWGNVHQWMDKHAGITFPEIAHRCITHHQAGIEEVRKMWGDEAAKAAEMHVRDDMEWAGYNRNGEMPKDREDAKRWWGDIDDFIEGD